MKLPNFENWSNGELSKSTKIWLSKSIFNVKNHWKILKWCPIFDSSPLLQFSKFNGFLCLFWFLAKNLSNFVSLPWKLHNWYCHNCKDWPETFCTTKYEEVATAVGDKQNNVSWFIEFSLRVPNTHFLERKKNHIFK